MNAVNPKDNRLVLLAIAAAAFFFMVTQDSAETAIIRLFIVLCCIPIHERAHANCARRLGDDTALQAGRVTFNPLSHFTLDGALLIFLFGFGFGKPVPVNPNNFPPEKRKWYHARTALAGPLSNLIMAVLFLLIGIVTALLFRNAKLYEILAMASYLNLSLAVFNMLPIPPLDGSSLLSLLPGNLYSRLYAMRSTLILLVFAASWILPRFGINIIGGITSWLFGLLYDFFALIFF